MPTKKAEQEVTQLADEALSTDEALSAEQQDLEETIKAEFEATIGIEGSDEDSVKMAMIKAGATFKNVTRLYNLFMIDAGLAISAADRKQIVNDTLDGRTFDTEDTFDASVKVLVESVRGATERSAAALIRSFAKVNSMEVFSKPKSAGGSRNPFVGNFHAALIENPTMSEDGLRDIIAQLDPVHQVNPNRWFSQHNNLRKTVNRVAEKLAS